MLDDPRVTFVKADIAAREAMTAVFTEQRPTAVVNFAAETHVDRSIDGPAPFIDTNIVGTFVLLECALALVRTYEEADRQAFRFLHVSTDEVYGTLGADGLFSEETPYAPNSPYAASKASADHLVRAYFHTYGLRTLITNCSNNYGPYQFPEKLIPLMISNALEGKPLPIYGDGMQVRDWLYVDDHCEALWKVTTQGKVGETYCIGGDNQPANIEIVRTICQILDELQPDSPFTPHEQLMTFVPDRPGHDRRYDIDISKINSELGWQPRHDLQQGLLATVRWYLEHPEWVRAITQQSDYDGWMQKNYANRKDQV